MLVDSENILVDGPDSLASAASFNDVPDFLEDREDSDCPEDHLAVPMLGDADPFWGVTASPLQDPKGKESGLTTDLPAWLPLSPLETSEEGSPESSEETSEDSPLQSPRKDSLKDPQESPLLSPLRIALLSPLPSPPAPPQRHPPRMAQAVEEALRRQPWVRLTRLPLPPGVVSGRVVPRSGEAGGKKAKRPAPASTPTTQETSPQDNTPPRKSKKMVARRVAKHP